MTTLKLTACAFFILLTGVIQAQVSVNIGSPPKWAPAGYSEAKYYYIPDIESYYDVRQSQFIYFGNGQWVRTRKLPVHYRHYDLYHGRTVVLTDYHGAAPYSHFKSHKVKYYKAKDGHKHGGHGKGHSKGHGKGHNKH